MGLLPPTHLRAADCCVRTDTQGSRHSRFCSGPGQQGLYTAGHSEGCWGVLPVSAGAARQHSSTAARPASGVSTAWLADSLVCTNCRGRGEVHKQIRGAAVVVEAVEKRWGTQKQLACGLMPAPLCAVLRLLLLLLRYFDFSPSLAEYIAAAALIISHAGGAAAAKGPQQPQASQAADTLGFSTYLPARAA